MKIKRFLVVGVIVALMLGLLGSAAVAAAPAEKVDFLIGFHRAPGPAEQALVRSAGGEIYGQFTIVDVIAARMTPRAADALARDPRVRYVELDGPVYALDQTVPWGIDRVFGDETYSFSTWTSSRGSGVSVAVVDTGIDKNHEDLVVVGGVRFRTTGLILRQDNEYDDDNGHGTHVAGTIAALDNSLGVVGVGPRIDLYAVKVLDASGSGSLTAVVAGIEWSANNGMSIISMSLGTSSHSQTLKDACDAAYSKGLLLVAAAGNSGKADGTGDNVGYPAKYDSVMAVAATDINDQRASWSSTGPAVELAAPGGSIYSTWKDNSYRTASGTSMACPHVTGVAALVWAVDPGLTNGEIRQILQETAEDLRLPLEHQGYGLVRANLAVRAVAEVEPPGTTYTITATAGEGGKIEPSGEVVVNEGDSQTFTITPYTGYEISDVVVDNVSVGVVSSYTFVNVTANHTIQATFEKITVSNTVRVLSITYSTSGGRFNDRHLAVTLLLLDDQDNPVANASVSATLYRNGTSWNFQGTTNSNGTVTFTLNNHGSGCYYTEVTAVVASGLTWDGVTPENSYCKS